MSFLNPRFPHRCRIYKIFGISAFSAGTKTIIYEGQCRKYTGYRATDPDGVAKEIYALSLPVIYQMGGTVSFSPHANTRDVFVDSTQPPLEGDEVEIETPLGLCGGRITQIMAGNIGTTIHWEDVKR
jgi:hypothetical protein